jgi:AmmeMemoRadiSam system protein A
MEFALLEKDKRTLLGAARESIASRLEKRPPRLPDPSPALREVCAVFVSLHSASGDLRGCIGNIIGRSTLIETVEEMAEASAFQDPRFEPLTAEELPSIRIEISILSPFSKAASPEEVIPGVHGIYIRRDRYSGLLLPQVAGERNWGREEFLTHGCFKAGLPGDSWRDAGTEIFTFTALVFSEPL